MKQYKKILMLGILASSCMVLNAYADDKASVSFGPTTDKAFFFCTAFTTDPSASVFLKTHNIDARGFNCDTPNKGSLTLTPAELNKYHFEVKQDKFRSGSVDATLIGNGRIECHKGMADGRTTYPGSKFCLINK